MPKYLIEREISGAGKLSPEELHGISRKSCDVLEGLGPQIQWVQSYATDDRICCIYIAPDADLIREHAGQGGFPVNRISEIRAGIDPTTAKPRWTRSVGATRDTGAGPAGPAPFHEAPWPPASDVPRAGGPPDGAVVDGSARAGVLLFQLLARGPPPAHDTGPAARVVEVTPVPRDARPFHGCEGTGDAKAVHRLLAPVHALNLRFGASYPFLGFVAPADEGEGLPRIPVATGRKARCMGPVNPGRAETVVRMPPPPM